MKIEVMKIEVMKIAALAFVAAVAVAGCGPAKKGLVPAGTSEPDKFLFDKGTAALDEKKWVTAREYFKQIVENYTQSSYRPDAKLGVGDTYLGEDTAESLVLAINEYKEFLTFYPTNKRADYAQYKLGMSHFRQMRAPQRDQSETREAIKEFQTFIERYPNSGLREDAEAKLREARDRIDAADYYVGLFYFRSKWYPGAIDRFQSLLKGDQAYSARDAVYYYLGESLLKVQRPAEALPYYERLVKEFEKSEYLDEARRRTARWRLSCEPIRSSVRRSSRPLSSRRRVSISPWPSPRASVCRCSRWRWRARRRRSSASNRPTPFASWARRTRCRARSSTGTTSSCSTTARRKGSRSGRNTSSAAA